jgi:hypothetical protein
LELLNKTHTPSGSADAPATREQLVYSSSTSAVPRNMDNACSQLSNWYLPASQNARHMPAAPAISTPREQWVLPASAAHLRSRATSGLHALLPWPRQSWALRGLRERRTGQRGRESGATQDRPKRAGQGECCLERAHHSRYFIFVHCASNLSLKPLYSLRRAKCSNESRTIILINFSF